MATVTLSLGSNVPYKTQAPYSILLGACRRLETVVERCAFSSVYQTKPMYVENQNDFLNMVVRGETKFSPRALLSKIHEIENAFGRNRKNEIRFGERTLDIDIELYGEFSLAERDLVIPHPRMLERAFVLLPLLEILDETADNKKKGNYAKILEGLGNQGVEKFASREKFLRDIRSKQ